MPKIRAECVECKKEFDSNFYDFKIHCSVGCQMKKYDQHSSECGWHKDWHSCNCGAFDPRETVDEAGST